MVAISRTHLAEVLFDVGHPTTAHVAYGVDASVQRGSGRSSRPRTARPGQLTGRALGALAAPY
ncbi:hypothetical protein [Geodermatophilus sp. URMC 64]